LTNLNRKNTKEKWDTSYLYYETFLCYIIKHLRGRYCTL